MCTRGSNEAAKDGSTVSKGLVTFNNDCPEGLVGVIGIFDRLHITLSFRPVRVWIVANILLKERYRLNQHDGGAP